MWKAALASRKDVEFHLYPKLNHLFFAGEGILTPLEYTQKHGSVTEEVVTDIAAWIGKRLIDVSGLVREVRLHGRRVTAIQGNIENAPLYYQRPGMRRYRTFRVYSLYPSRCSVNSCSSPRIRGISTSRKSTVGINAQ